MRSYRVLDRSVQYVDRGNSSDLCNYGPAYSCRECQNVAMQKSCAGLPPQIHKHTFHPHPLRFNLWDLFLCDACRRLTFGFINYQCMHCELKLDFRCAMAIFNDENEVAKRTEEEDRPIHHFCHPHQLKRCLFSPTTQSEKEF
ncbi:hypothetical protein F3Y22_tig00017792pilonHSYRG00048 [Hibiscus syriacus]|uniref:DC1 domain-containing protein n=1 Tax=Hibiscus syriacus TaxID=106335 RepID=A0A6A3BYF4_HIBSY|nr:hypothetical protein F3Y22_tig00017792pilonHSYRG00048 [Hibiscus syriacus]